MPKVIQDAEGRIRMFDAGGVPVSVTRDDYAQAVKAGYKPQTADEAEAHEKKKQRSTGVEQAKTAAEGALRGATFGLGTAALAELGGEEYRQAAIERAEENPNLAVGSEIFGAAVPALLSGGSGALGTAARLTPAAQLGRAGLAAERGAAALARGVGLGSEKLLPSLARDVFSGAVGAGVETAAYGAGSAIADDALEGKDWTVERALEGAGEGGLYGLAAGGLFGAKKTLVKKGVEGAASATIDAMRSGGQTFKKAVENFAEGSLLGTAAKKGASEGDELIARLSKDGADTAGLQRMSQRLRDAGAEGGSRGEVAAIARDEAEALLARKTQAAAELTAQGARVDALELKGQLLDVAAEMRAAGTKEHTAAARKLETLSKRDVTTLEAADALHADVENVVSWARENARAALPDLEKAARGVSGKVDEAAAGLGPEAQAAWSGIRQEASDWATMASKLGSVKLTDAEAGKFIAGLGLAGSLATGTPLPSLLAFGAAHSPAARQFVAERGGSGLSWLAARASNVESAITATAKGIAGSDIVGAVKSAIPGRKPSSYRSVIDAIQTYPLHREKKRENYEAARKAVQEFQTNPAPLQARIEATIAPIARSQPEVAAAMAQRVTEDYVWLGSKIPVPMTRSDNSLTPLLEEDRLPDREKIRFANYAEALSSPMSVFASIANGHVNWDGIEALKERRPDLWNTMRFRVIQALNEAPEPPAFRKRVLLGLAFDFPSDWSMANVSKIQATFAQAPDTGNGKPAMAGISTDMMALPAEQGSAP